MKNIFDGLTKENISQGFGVVTDAVAKVASKGAEGSRQVGRNLAKGAEKLRDNVSQDIAMRRETVQIKEECEKIIQQSAERSLLAEQSFLQEQRYFAGLVQQVEQKQLAAYARFYHFVRENRPEPAAHAAVDDGTVDLSMQGCDWLQVSGYAAKAAATGAAAGALAVGAVTAFGTAGTGAAISSLTGPAYVNATLAALGGGSLASGGLGMAGGAAVLGAAIAAPILVVSAVTADKKIRKDYQSVKEWQERVVAYAAETQRVSAMAHRGREALRVLNQEIFSFAAFFQDMLNMGAATTELGDNERYLPLLNDAATVLIAFTQISLVTKEKQFNEQVEEETAVVKQAVETCRGQFYQYYISLGHAAQQEMEKNRTRDLQQAFSRLQNSVNTMRDEMHQGFARVDQGISDLKGSLRDLDAALHQFQSQAETKIQNCIGQGAEIEDIMQDFSQRLSDCIMQNGILQQQSDYVREKAALHEAFGSSWQKLSSKSQGFLITSKVLYAKMTMDAALLDYSGVCILAAKAMEEELKQRFYKGFLGYMKKRFAFPSEVSAWPSVLYHKNRMREYVLLPEYKFTLGSVSRVCCTYRAGLSDRRVIETDKNRILEYSRDVLFKGTSNMQDIGAILQTIGADADHVTKKYRNPAAHTGNLRQHDARRCLDELIDVEKKMVWLMDEFSL